MKRVSKAVGAIVAVGIAIAAVATTSPSLADSPDQQMFKIDCNAGAVNISLTDASTGAGWHINKDAPWKWDGAKPASIDEHNAKWAGGKCAGSVKAFICNGDKCKGPITLTVH